MTKPEIFDKSKYALERGQWLNRQSLSIAELSNETIQKSRELLMAMAQIEPKFKGPKI